MNVKILILVLLFIFVINTAYALTEEQKENLERTLDLAEDNKGEYERVLSLLEEKNVDLGDEEELLEKIQNDMERLGIEDYQGFKTEKSSLKVASIVLLLFIAVVLIIVLKFGFAEFYRRKNKKLRQHEPVKSHKKHKSNNDFEKVTDYIKKCTHSGYTQEHIKKLLLENGWKENIIDKAFETVKKLK